MTTQAQQALDNRQIAILHDTFLLQGSPINVSGTVGMSRDYGIELAVAGSGSIADLQEIVAFVVTYLTTHYTADTFSDAFNVKHSFESLPLFELTLLPQTDGVRKLYELQLGYAPQLPDFQHVQIALYDRLQQRLLPGQLILT